VRRFSTTNEDGVPVKAWADVAENVPCLLDAGKRQLEPLATQDQQQIADRSGTLFALPGNPIKPGDRVVLTHGGTGAYVVQPDPAQVLDLNGTSHYEFRVEQVPGA
jgi:hypothetical protein